MEKQDCIKALRQKLLEAEALFQESGYSSPKFKIWDQLTEKYLRTCLDPETLEIFTGVLRQSNYAYPDEARRLFIKHVQDKKEALQSLIELLESDESAIVEKGSESTAKKASQVTKTRKTWAKGNLFGIAQAGFEDTDQTN